MDACTISDMCRCTVRVASVPGLPVHIHYVLIMCGRRTLKSCSQGRPGTKATVCVCVCVCVCACLLACMCVCLLQHIWLQYVLCVCGVLVRSSRQSVTQYLTLLIAHTAKLPYLCKHISNCQHTYMYAAYYSKYERSLYPWRAGS